VSTIAGVTGLPEAHAGELAWALVADDLLRNEDGVYQITDSGGAMGPRKPRPIVRIRSIVDRCGEHASCAKMRGMQKREIEIVIDMRGGTAFQVKGVKGKACLGETKFLEEALGGDVLARDTTDEYYGDPSAGVLASAHVGGADEEAERDD
jgi:hypothetical protein